MKKRFFVFIICIISILITGCGLESDSKMDDLELIGEEYKPEKLIVGCGQASEPIVWVDNNEIRGHEADLWAAFTELTGVPVEFIPSEFSALFGYLDSGRIDTVANQITLNEMRVEKYNFPTPYAYMPEKLMVRSDCEWNKIKDIDGSEVGYSNGSNGKNLFEQIEIDHNISVKINAYEGDALLQALYSGKIDAVIVPGASYAYKINNGTLEFNLVDESITYGSKGYPFRKDNEEAIKKKEFVENAFETLRENGTLTNLSEKWYKEDFTFLPDGIVPAN